MTEQVKEGWYEDPADRHEYRWFSQGAPTDLVMDRSRTSRDAITLKDPMLYRSMPLAQPPDDGPLLRGPSEARRDTKSFKWVMRPFRPSFVRRMFHLPCCPTCCRMGAFCAAASDRALVELGTKAAG